MGEPRSWSTFVRISITITRMAEEFDIEALLEAPYSKKDASSKSRENDDGRTSSRKSKKRSRSRSRDRDRNDRARSRDRDRKNRDEKRSKRRSRSKSRDKDKEKEKEKDKDKHRRRKSRSKDRRRSPSPLLLGPRREREKQTNNNFRFDDLTPEERDARTVFCMQLSQRVRARDLEEFFSSVGKVRDVRLIMCNKTRRFKGISYVEFRDPESVALAMGLSGQKLLGVPIVVQHTQAEKNRQGNSMISMMSRGASGPCKLYVGSLHFNITEDMLRGIFEPFGKIDSIQLQMDPETGRSRGYGFVTYRDAEDAKRALEQLNGFE
ncbi:Hypothetical predicted protein [Cloeon dipterum]|uniref:RRM domain-containing protein n=1 Tax=Cloeon dipterum TaxID=197152 RepID=A0A8S1BN92_9INSE|nr:Hypothetical predicted protein [Cloeon dipterum]